MTLSVLTYSLFLKLCYSKFCIPHIVAFVMKCSFIICRPILFSIFFLYFFVFYNDKNRENQFKNPKKIFLLQYSLSR